MKVTPTLKEELANWLDTYWTTYLKGDIKTWATFIRDDYRNIGGTKEEIWNSKQEIINYTNSIMDQMLGTVDIRNRKVELIPYGEYMMVHEFTDLFVKVEGEWTFYGPFRMSSLLEKTETGWIALHQHGSYPDMKAMEGEAFSVDALKAENAKLQAAVKSRTIELEIETALEKVRAEAMGIKKPDDILAVCKIMFRELQLLGFPELRNTLINFWDDERSSLIDYDYSDETGGHKAILLYSSHPVFEQFQKKIKNSQDAFAELVVTKDELESWKQRRRDSGEYEDPRLNDIDALYYYFYSIAVGAIGISTFKSITEEQLNILKRFRNVFDFAYRRYADVAQAEAQVREAQIEAALERVRSRSMAMYKSDELADLSLELVKQVQALGVATWFCAFNIYDNDPQGSLEWGSNGQGTFPKYRTPKEAVFLRYYEAGQRGETFLLNVIDEKECPAHYEYLCSLPGVGDQLLKMKEAGIPFPAFQIDHVAFFKYGYILFITYEPVPEAHDIFKRFAKIFEQTYTRFLDLQKAEAQSREAQINLAVERVRARALAMYKSEEILELVFKLKQEMMDLDIPNVVAATIHLKEKDGNYTMWDLTAMEYSEGKLHQPMVVYYRLEEVDPNLFIKRMWDNTDPYFLVIQDEEDFKRTIQFLRDHDRKKEADESEAYLKNAGIKYGYHPTIPLQNGRMCIDLLEPPSNEIEQILTKMGAAFDLAYKRFEDLKNSEAQLKEALIEAALERVRGRSMAMHKSEELKEVIKIVYQQLRHLNIHLDHAGFVVDYKPKGDWHFWIADEQDIPSKITHPYFESVWANQFNEAKEKGEDFFATHLNFEKKNKFYNELLSYVPGLPEASKDFYLSCPGLAASTVLLENVGLYIENFSGTLYTDEENTTLMRFGKVFQQTYTRFLDLQKAEAQAREAQIELGLERVRARAMAMQKSGELRELIGTVFTELTKLDLVLTRCLIMIYDLNTKGSTWWMANSEAPSDPIGLYIKYHEYPPYTAYINAWQERKNKWQYILEGTDKKEWDDFIFTETELSQLPDFVIEGMKEPDRVYLNASFNSFGNLTLASLQPLSDEHFDILLRFAKVFDLTYTRFNDLQKAEAQAREAKIEAALEKARARTMGMQSSDELPEVANVLFLEVQGLGIPAWSCGYNILADDKTSATCCMSSEGTLQTPFKLRLFGEASFAEMGDFFRSEQTMLVQELGGEALKEHYAYMKSFPDLKSTFDQIDELGLSLPTYQINHLCKFTQGFLLFITYEKVPESHDIFKRFTKVFEQTYTRFLDLQKAEAQALRAEQDLIEIKVARKKAEEALSVLQETQTQLIQSEKMASLGELTAGIAHEIQNPLNFVNNFSEVSKEMLDEMREAIENGNTEEAKEIMNDVIKNLEKINHHGKRADGIVKGMLQHSRSSSGAKEPTDINALADEYLRLAYHGLRAKDKSFNAAMKTDFDQSIGNINIIPQDLGRVILNLITNAFYVVNEKKNQGLPGYEPTVTVKTSKITRQAGEGGGATVLISVRDNGPGIPQKILDKIFQPFFTTKPAGQGTGLGLSLSYDIVKAHGGELKVETKEGEGSEFILLIPV